MEGGTKGSVTSMSSLFPADEAQKAAKRVQDTIAEKLKELDSLKGFISDNTNLINLVQRLPDQLHHDIMVPFGKAAFFPGRLIHTNEFMVLLGEGYYAERTAKHTVEILKRRDKELESQVGSLNANLEDLKAEASFFDATAAEAVEGLIEIREDYVEESLLKSESESVSLEQVSSCGSGVDNTKKVLEDEEFARIMARLDELEKEELEAECNNESDGEEKTNAVLDNFSDQISLEEVKISKEPDTRNPPKQATETSSVKEHITNRQYYHDLDPSEQLTCTGLTVQSTPKNHTGILSDKLTHGNILSIEKTSAPPAREKVAMLPSSSYEAPLQTSKPEFDPQKAFTGSIVERTVNIEMKSKDQTSAPLNAQPSKPVSRFKMQRR